MTRKPATKIWRCLNRGCTHPFSRGWHRVMAERIEQNAGPAMVRDFEWAHPDPDLVPCDDCGMTGGRHRHSVEH